MPCLKLPDKEKKKGKTPKYESHWSRIASITSYNKSYNSRKQYILLSSWRRKAQYSDILCTCSPTPVFSRGIIRRKTLPTTRTLSAEDPD